MLLESSFGIRISKDSITIDFNKRSEDAWTLEFFIDPNGTNTVRETSNGKTTVEILRGTTYLTAASRYLRTVLSYSVFDVSTFKVRLTDDALSRYNESDTFEFLEGIEDVLKSRKTLLRVDTFVFHCRSVDQNVLMNVLPYMEPLHLRAIKFVGGSERKAKTDLHDVALLPQWKYIQKLYSHFPITSSYWEKIEAYQLKAPKLDRFDIEHLKDILDDSSCCTNQVILDVRHLSLRPVDIEDIMDEPHLPGTQYLTFFQLEQGIGKMEYDDGHFKITRI